MKTPSTKAVRFRKRYKKTQSKKLDLTALQNENIATAFKEQTMNNLVLNPLSLHKSRREITVAFK